ncbi:polysaccharide pyruvyl transferase family protein [Polaribacter sp. IC073]|uniref:polysaccharide pyruvyl transferase family protein n=1 Tax=Polaribacter sp. IC073 TaxID=2508540 RepID=UPI0011BE750D|nr:polysaccharide pyruvyl transferase family protein [Polaribacter sp. IC073]TXD48924.1 polysaccharide pyruvyl transferase family protein [Polaribacter sp. IC073]
MKKKIGLLTMPLLNNYGGIIQVAALYHYLKEEGFEPYIIDKKYNQSNLKVLIKKILTHNPFYKLYDYNNHTQRRLQLKKVHAFIDNYFENKTDEVFNEIDLKRVSQQFDTVVVGSDQVWRHKYVKNNFEQYFLNFLSSKQNKVSYAASFGVDAWEGDEASKKQVSKLLSNFNAVSVREDTGVALCENVFGHENATHVLDPTFLPDVSFYESIIKMEVLDKKVGLFNYVLDASIDKQDIIKDVSNKLNLNIDTIHLEEREDKNIEKPSISEWLYHLKNADFIITDSFHGTVFSIIFNKQFITIGNPERGMSRFNSLLKKLNLDLRLIYQEDKNQIDTLLHNKIDYQLVNAKLALLKKESKNFLLSNI